MEYDLEERTLKFSENTIGLLKTIKLNAINRSIVNQLVRSATSVGANYCEANGASSKKDFKNKIHICKKEIKETKYWLQLLVKTNNEKKGEIRKLWKEAQELTLIFSKIIITMKKR
ncbi:MAG: four helix bundle protein [Patescibacteria group bacterium]|nr:four helix bundle protein [Patescibacteria group bacterium]